MSLAGEAIDRRTAAPLESRSVWLSRTRSLRFVNHVPRDRNGAERGLACSPSPLLSGGSRRLGVTDAARGAMKGLPPRASGQLRYSRARTGVPPRGAEIRPVEPDPVRTGEGSTRVGQHRRDGAFVGHRARARAAPRARIAGHGTPLEQPRG